MSQPLPLVAIIGRPNVGKSTLFNRITGTRQAIMEETAGVTRDRLYGRGEWDGYVFDVVDTGGVEEPDGDELRTAMMQQTEAAMDEADVLIVLLDGVAGLTGPDHDLIARLRDTKKPVLYAANKIDSTKREAGAYALYEAGIDNLYLVSAEHGRGVDELLDAVIEALPHKVESSELADDEEGPIRIAVVGRPNVGKSSLINALVGADRTVVSEVPGTTRDVIDTRLDVGDDSYILLDTAGIRRKAKVHEKLEKFTVIKALEAVERCDVALLVMDATRGIGEEQDAKIAGYLQDAFRAVVVVVNKWDLKSEREDDRDTVRQFEKELRYQIKFLPFARVHFVSALTGKGVGGILSTVKASYEQFSRRVSTSELNEVIAKAVEKNPPKSPGGRHVRIRYATQVDIRPPTFVIITNRPKDVHITYRRYLTNQLYEAFGFQGSPLKLRFRQPKGRWKASEKFS